MGRASIDLGILIVVAFGAACSHVRPAGDPLHVVEHGEISYDAADDQKMTLRIDEAAREFAEYAPIPRIAFFDLAYPANAEEYVKLAGYGVLLITTISQIADELPLGRVYVRTALRDLTLKHLATRRLEVQDSPARPIATLGRYRADSIYLFPLHLRADRGELLADFARNRDAFVIAQFPLEEDASTANLPVSIPLVPGPPASALAEFIDREVPLFSGSR